MGPGKADLLEAIDKTRSISAAGRTLGLSYWKVRALMDEMAQCFRAPVVEAIKGGSGGGGAQLTALGREALDRFRAMELRAEKGIAEDMKVYRKLLKKRSE